MPATLLEPPSTRPRMSEAPAETKPAPAPEPPAVVPGDPFRPKWHHRLTIRFLKIVLWPTFWLLYGLRTRNKMRIPKEGAALLVGNHVSWLDGILLVLVARRRVRGIAYADYVQKGFWGYICRAAGVIPIKSDGGPKALLRSLQSAKQALENGDVVCIFAEGAITRTGQLQAFQGGMLRILRGLDHVPIIPFWIDGLWGSIFSYRGGKFFWKWPRKLDAKVTVTYGEPMLPEEGRPLTQHQVRSAVQELGVEVVEKRMSEGKSLTLPRRFLRACKKARFRSKVADSSGRELTGGKLLAGSLIMKKLLKKHVLDEQDEKVGVLLPPAVAAAVVNTSLTLLHRVSVNLNYTLDEATVNYCIKEAGVRKVLTSRRFLEKKPYELDAEVIFLEDLAEKVGKLTKIGAALQAFLVPAFILERTMGLTRIKPDDLLTIIFTSGSTGEPKGVMLSHKNVLANVGVVDSVLNITKDDVLLGVLPFFHSFGYTVTLWLPAALAPKVVYHFNPLDGRQVAKLSKKHGVSILLATPTFLRTYLKRCTAEDFHRLNLVVTGAEKLPRDLVDDFNEKFGVEPAEGYGCTETSPVISVNVPNSRNAGGDQQPAFKIGCVGRPLPNVTARVVNPDTGKELGSDEEGLLQVKGPNVMLGYLNRPEQTAEVINEGWYNTGDFAVIDAEGFIAITGRQSRFSKIGGEMVPHLKVEELLLKIVSGEATEAGDSGEEDEAPTIPLAVTSVPHPTKGERLIVLHTPMSKSVADVLAELKTHELPNLWLPAKDGFVEVAEIPMLGSGKLDLKAAKEIALRETGETGAN